MKKNVTLRQAWLLSLFMLVTLLMLTACGSDTTADETNSEEPNQSEGETYNLSVSHHLPSHHPIQTEVLEPFLAELEAGTDGRITGDIYAANSLGDPSAHYELAVTGVADISLTVHGFTPGVFPLVQVIEFPFFTKSAEKGSEIIWRLYEEFPELQEEHADTTPLWLFTAEPAQILSASKPIKTLEDMKGLRVRSPSPLANKIIEALGATPVSMPMGDVYEALARGTIDAAMAPFSTAHDYNFHEVIDYITVGYFSMTPFFSVMNTDLYESLSDHDRELIDGLTGLKMAQHAGATFDKAGERGKQTAQEKGVELIELDEDQLALWQEALEPVIEEWINEMEHAGLPGQAIYDRAVELSEELN
ncbi:TRAP-type C4-dicarboxylate transport system substrate-binding protein [Caldalkalibacillus uzonensis]|uniref:TRAP-type C4-dicarboxylate transport system substrate-binding protein n=1 Tax=Caldalkalibacillus uzonensis TaxID=353224 RepID=A0ABU0CY07_9BACI|nr:TRAP transporter substrate-binding protein [Caldalkalibacillus uzonensis]MDQ0341026.1 TRAP-type C4-dicarboxylate transport system substrate-binding protein [Caldalkalibacillus uzonensis]